MSVDLDVADLEGTDRVAGGPGNDLRQSPERGWHGAVKRFWENRVAMLGLAIVVFLVLFSFIGPLIYRTHQVITNPGAANLAPSAQHLLGTNDVGYDVLGRLMLGGQSSLEVGLGAALVTSILGTVWGAVAGFVGGVIDAVMMRVVDTVLAIPPLVVLLLLGTLYTPTVPLLILAIALITWVPSARLVRGEALTLRVRDYVQAARGAGARTPRLVGRHVIPNIAGTIIVQTTFNVANAISLFALVSYLGLGPPPPAANWGGMLSDGLSFLYEGYWWLIYPAGIAIVLTVVAFNFVGEGLRDVLEVRTLKR
jgi:peptide/nickel transport system permease protein